MSVKRVIPDQSGFPAGVTALANALDRGELSAVQALEHYLGRIGTYDAHLNSFITVTAEMALEQARASDLRRERRQSLGVLDGIPVAVKDNTDVAGILCTGGLAARSGHVAAQDAAAVAFLRAGGAVIIGKTNLHEAALGATTDNPVFGKCHNPHRLDYTPGGSSGGSGAAVAAGFCAAALGTDTLGSVRIPAAYCGCYGFKPSSGLISNRGVLPLSRTLDHVGVLAPCVQDLWPLLSVLARFDPQCPGSRKTGEKFPATAMTCAIKELRVAILGRLESAVDLSDDTRQTYLARIAELRDNGVTIIAVDLDYDFSHMRRCGLLISEAEAAVVHWQAMQADPDGYSEDLRRMLHWGARQSAHRLAAAYSQAAETVVLMRQLFQQFDALLLPSAPQTAFPFAAPAPVNQADLTGLANLARCPAISIPAGYSREGLPIGLQLVGAELEDRKLLRIAASFSPLLHKA